MPLPANGSFRLSSHDARGIAATRRASIGRRRDDCVPMRDLSGPRTVTPRQAARSAEPMAASLAGPKSRQTRAHPPSLPAQARHGLRRKEMSRFANRRQATLCSLFRASAPLSTKTRGARWVSAAKKLLNGARRILARIPARRCVPDPACQITGRSPTGTLSSRRTLPRRAAAISRAGDTACVISHRLSACTSAR